MGLNFRIGLSDESEVGEFVDVDWSYGGFMRARERLAAALGIQLQSMEGFEDNLWCKNPPAGRPWNEIDDAIVPFLHHSDCDGYLDIDQCRSIAPRLREIIAPWPEGDDEKQRFSELANAMDKAVAKGQMLIFC